MFSTQTMQETSVENLGQLRQHRLKATLAGRGQLKAPTRLSPICDRREWTGRGNGEEDTLCSEEAT